MSCCYPTPKICTPQTIPTVPQIVVNYISSTGGETFWTMTNPSTRLKLKSVYLEFDASQSGGSFGSSLSIDLTSLRMTRILDIMGSYYAIESEYEVFIPLIYLALNGQSLQITIPSSPAVDVLRPLFVYITYY